MKRLLHFVTITLSLTIGDALDLTALLLGMNSAEEVREKYLKIPFAYPGAKGDHLAEILPHLPYGSGYGEAFGGTGVVLLNRDPSKLEIFNDRYSGVTDFFRVVRDPKLYPLFMERVNATVHSREEFIWCKATWKNHDDTVERAARWYYTVRFAINGKARSTFGRSRDPIVRFADRLHKSLPMFGPLHHRLHTVTIENLDWRLCLQDFDQKGFVWYLDPTYLDCSPGNYDEELSVADHSELFVRIQNLQGFVALSTFDGPQTRAIYDKAGVWDEVIEWKRTSTAGTQAANESNGHTEIQDRVKKNELLWIRRAK